ncbi:MAG: tail fiber domain-containing protein, partial [Dysgonamonadaceae bacterium]|nr:tail fiber domain-containing protein [Dysgonamonadaceae bacterium]
TGDFNTAGGSWALYDNTTGSYNTASGDYALSHNTTGNFNTAVGAYVSVKETDLSNATAIGYLATATSSNQVKIGNGSVTSIGGFADWTNFSDKRAKKNIRTDVPGLVFINRLQPVTYTLDLDAVDGLLKID